MVESHRPKEGMSQAWDDMMNAPHRMGRVPPGWKAPSIDIPTRSMLVTSSKERAPCADHHARQLQLQLIRLAPQATIDSRVPVAPMLSARQLGLVPDAPHPRGVSLLRRARYFLFDFG